MRIDPELSVVVVGPAQVQVGNGPRSVVVDASTPGVRRVLTELQGQPKREWTTPLLAQRSGLDEAEVDALLSGLAPVLVSPAGDLTDGGAAPPEDGRALLPESVHVVGLGATGVAVADLLLRLGLQGLCLSDSRPVTADLLAAGLVCADIGRPRADALAHRLGERGAAVAAIRDDPRRRVAGATVLVQSGGWDVDRLSRAQAAGHPVLPVLLRDTDTLVGPWCAPDVPGCPLCWERWAEQEDPLRAARTAALRRAGAGRDPARRAHRSAEAVADALTGGPAPGVALQVADSAHGSVQVETVDVPAWPGCGCGCGCGCAV